MAKKVTIAEQMAVNLFEEMLRICPEHYDHRTGRYDRLGDAWRAAVDSAAHALRSVEELGNLVREKAGITAPGPARAALDRNNEAAAQRVAKTAANAGEGTAGIWLGGKET